MSNHRLLADIYFSSDDYIENLDKWNAAEYLESLGVSPRCIEIFWGFIVLSLLNVPLRRCSAAEFAMLVKKWAHLKHRRFGFPTVGLGDIYVDEAERYIKKRGGMIRRKTAVTKIIYKQGVIDHVVAKTDDSLIQIRGDIFVSTINPVLLRPLVAEADLDRSTHSDFLKTLDIFEGVPYISVNIWFDKKISSKQFWAMLGRRVDGVPYLNTDFYDFSNIYESRKHASYIASNIIYSKEHENLSDLEIIERTVDEIRETFPRMDASVVHSHVHRIPYVIYAPVPGTRAHRHTAATPIPNLYLAGDWVVREVPQCMEAAVRSGYKCAEAIFAQHGIFKQICDDRVF